VPDVHVSHFEGRSKSLLKIGLEVLLISAGVFLGLLGEQWREHAHQRELAELSLRRFRTEIVANRKAVAGVKDYHVTLKKSVDTFLKADAKARRDLDVDMRGLQPANFEHTAWDLALVTQSLAYIDPQLAFALSRIYTGQQTYVDLSRGMMQRMYLRTPAEDTPGFLSAVSIYYGDLVILEPGLLSQYDDVLPQIDRALGVR